MAGWRVASARAAWSSTPSSSWSAKVTSGRPRHALPSGRRVSLRTVFHHFADLEALFAAAADRQTDDVRRLVVPVPHDGELGARLDAFVQQRARLLERSHRCDGPRS